MCGGLGVGGPLVAFRPLDSAEVPSKLCGGWQSRSDRWLLGATHSHREHISSCWEQIWGINGKCVDSMCECIFDNGERTRGNDEPIHGEAASRISQICSRRRHLSCILPSHSSDPYVSFTCPSSSAADALSCVNCYSTLWVDNWIVLWAVVCIRLKSVCYSVSEI